METNNNNNHHHHHNNATNHINHNYKNINSSSDCNISGNDYCNSSNYHNLENVNTNVAPIITFSKFAENIIVGSTEEVMHIEAAPLIINLQEISSNYNCKSGACTDYAAAHDLYPSLHYNGACSVLQQHNSCDEHHDRLLSYLYISYLLCRWGDRMWEFAVGLFMVEIWKKSLLLASLYGLVETASVVALGVIVGEWVDRFPRLKVIQISLAFQNVSVFSATMAILTLLLTPWPTTGGSVIVFSSLVGLVTVLGGISALATLATKISLERDWVVIMAAERPSRDLTKINAMMRRIDLSCTLLAAVFVGLIMSAVSVVASAILIATWNIICVGLEYWFLLNVYNKTPRLHERQTLYHLASKLDKTETVAQNFKEPPHPFDIDLKSFHERLLELCKLGTTLWNKVWTLSVFEGWKIYLRQENMLAGIAFSLLSVSVLSFGTLMTASLKWRGCPAYVLGLARGCAALIGICATLSYPLLHARLQTLRAGMFSITLQWCFLTLCVVSIWLKNLDTSTEILISGAAAARAGLWMFDLSVTQLMQESVPESERGVVAGVQNSMQSFFHLLSFAVAMIIPHPQDFSKLILMSFGAVTMAALIYAIQMYYTCKNRGFSATLCHKGSGCRNTF